MSVGRLLPYLIAELVMTGSWGYLPPTEGESMSRVETVNRYSGPDTHRGDALVI